MKVYINKYKHHWISPITIVEYMFFWTEWSKCGRNKYAIPDEDYVNMPKWADKLADCLTPLSKAIQYVWDLVDRKINYVKIDHWDTWSMDSTLALIVLPMLKQLHATKHGAPNVSDDDVPDHLKSTAAPQKEDEWDADDNHFKRWDYVLEEMIFAFQCLADDSWEEEFHSGTIDIKFVELENSGFNEMVHGENHTHKWDREGWEKVNQRINNGLVLFGKYYRNLWD